MVRKHFSGEKTFTIRLDPPELGEIKVELKIDKDKRAKAVISASNHEALGDLTKSVKELAQSLKDGGVDINEEDFEFNLNQQSNDNEFAQNAKSQSNDKSSDKNTSEEVQPEVINQINRDINRTQVWHNVRVSLIA
nr:flagellar hook-length control protein FliK [Pseudaquidulcibacter saccharophilus]